MKRRLAKAHKEELDATLSIQKDALAKASADEYAKKKAGGADGGGAPPAAASKEDLVAARKARLDELYRETLAEYDEVLART